LSIAIIRTFTRLRNSWRRIRVCQKPEELEAKHDDQFREVFEAIWALMEEKKEGEQESIRTMGFVKGDAA
jgi:hypothetical protein